MKPGSHNISLIKSKANRLLILFSTFSFAFLFSFSQTNISGVVNSYYQVIEVIPAKACVRLNTVTGLARLQKVLLIQMKGATVRENNNSFFGDTLSLNDAGNYEVAVICSINGDSVFMFHNFLNSYTVADKVQLVKFAEYYSANVIDTVKASPWNNVTGTGGVIAINVSENLTLNAPVYADASGFKGGRYVLSNGFCLNGAGAATDYFYDGSLNTPIIPQNGAYKGESVYDFPQAQSGGRGAPANGGGGGNNHNNGGGGGANLSIGGKGGGNSSSGGCTTELHGGAGKALGNWNGKKLFFGGGGGAGHSDGSATISNGGGNGGGIIFIHAGTLIGNSYRISANGAAGGTAMSDGASGGGAAGTIIMDVNTYSGSVTMQANGGNGGDENDLGTMQRCYGAGGGGSGGVAYFTGSIPAIPISVTGGTAGLEYGGDPACNAAVPAANGSNGSTISSYTIRQSTDYASYCLSISPLPVRLMYFKAVTDQANIILQWQVANPELAKEFIPEKLIGTNWSPVNIIPANDLNENYVCIDAQPLSGINLYRLKIIEKNNAFFYSLVQQIIMNAKDGHFVIYPNPATHQLFITGELSAYTEIKLFQLTGKLIWQKTQSESTNKLIIDLPVLSRGVYLLKINEEIKKLILR